MEDMRKYYEIVKESKCFLASLPDRKEPSLNTVKQYESVYGRLAKTRQTPIELAKTKSSYYAYRAAWLYICEREAKSYLKAADKEKDQDVKISLIRSAKKLVDAIRQTPPDFDGKNLRLADAGDYVSEWKQSKKFVQKSKSKKRQVSRLPSDWQQRFFDRLSGSKYQTVVSVIALCGARPVELHNGVRLCMDGGGIRFEIQSAKNHGGKYGQGLRSFTVHADNAMFQHLKDFISKGGEVVSVTSAKTLCEKMRGFSRDVFPSTSNHVSAYTFRHAFAAEAKAILGADGAAVCLGHCNDLSQTFYSRAKKSGSFRIENVVGERKNVKHVTNNNLADIFEEDQPLRPSF
jgi:integrase